MSEKIRSLISEIKALEDELQNAIHGQQSRIFFSIDGKRVKFERSMRETHKRLKRNVLHWLITDRPQNLFTAPIIYGMLIPLVLLDVCVSLFQLICFPIYGIAGVKRSDYLAFDRRHLGYLNWFERFHCNYCAYANGLIAFTVEIVARTEQYFCPIKHARKILGTHARYIHFLEFGDAQDYHSRLEAFRRALKDGGTPP